jgi:DNA-binding CsgD family transcriptional regulator
MDLVGRDPERRRIAAAIAADRPVAVAGEAGIGKSSLLRVVADETGVPIRSGGGFATLISQPYLALARATGIGLTGDPVRVAATIERLVGPDLLVIDDLQWVDGPSMEVLGLLAGRIQLLTTIRTGDVRSGVALALASQLGMAIVELGGLDAADARTIVTRVRPGLGASGVDAVVARAGGNPLLLEEIAAHGEPSAILTRIFETSLDQLTPDARAVVELLAVADRPIERSVLPLDHDATTGSGVLVEHDGTVTIRHALLAEAIRARMDAPTTAACHERLAEILDDPLERARHLAAAGLTDRAVDLAHRALGDTTDPRRRAVLLAIVAESMDAPSATIPRIEAAGASAALSDWETVIRLLEPIADDAPDALGVERAALVARACYGLGHHAEARRALEAGRAIDVDPASDAAAHLAIETAALMVNLDGEILPALDLLDAAIDHHAATDPSVVMLRAIRASIAMLAAQPVDVDLLSATIEGAMAVGAYSSAADLARVVTYAFLIWSGAEPALGFIGEMAGRFESAGVSAVALELEAERVQAAILAGRPTEAIGFADELLERPAPLRARQTAAIHRARALAIVGRTDEGRASLAALSGSITDDFIGRGEWLVARADIELWAGMPERAIESAQEAMTVPSPIANAYVQPHITRAWARHDLGLPQEPIPEVAPTRVAAGARPELTALAHLADGDHDAAAEHFDAAATLWAGFDALRALTCRWAAGEALRQAGRLERMTECLTSALAEATSAGVEVVAIRVRRSMRRAGLRPASETPAGARTGLRLTARERELLDLAGRGLTNIEIARRMGLGRPTVARILSNAMSKLGAESRAQAVAMVATD